MRLIITLMAACAIATVGSNARAHDQTNTDKFVSKDDYLKLKEDHAKLKQELDALKNQMQEVLKKTAAPESEALDRANLQRAEACGLAVAMQRCRAASLSRSPRLGARKVRPADTRRG